MTEDIRPVKVEEEMFLEKFIGEPLPENLFERLTIVNGVVVKKETFKEVD